MFRIDVFWTSEVWLWPLLPVVAAGAVSLTWWAYRATRPAPGGVLGRTLFALRAAALVLLVLAIAGPIISRVSSRPEPAELLIVLEDSSSMAIQDAGGTEHSRWERSLDLAAAVDSLLEAAGAGVHVRTVRGNGLEPLRETAADLREGPPPTARGTSLGRLGRQIREQVARRPVRAALLLSDGCETEGRNPTAGRGSAGASLGGVQLVAVGVGDPIGPADRVVKDLRYPGTAYQGDEVVVEVAVDHRFAAGRPAPLTARLVGPDSVLAEVTVAVEQDLVPLELTFRPDRVGPLALRLEISPLDNERYLQNNEASLVIDVRQERASLLLLAGRPGWDVRFLAQAAARESRLEMTVVYPGPDGLVRADSLTSWTPPHSESEWGAWDGVVLLGWDGASADLDWAQLSAAVHGGLGLLVVAPGLGDADVPTLIGPPHELLSLLPVSARVWRWIAGSHVLWQPDGAAAHSVLEGLTEAGEAGSEGRATSWNDLPPLRGVLDVEVMPGGRALLAVRTRADRGVREVPVLAAMPRSEGRVGWFGGRDLWELAFWEAETVGPNGAGAGHLARKLMRNLLVWTAEGEQERELAFLGSRTAFQEGERIRLASSWRDLRGEPVTGRRISLVLTGAAEGGVERERTFPLVERTQRPGEAEVELPPLQPGAYTVQLVGEGEPAVSSRRERLVVTPHSIEATQVRQDVRRLRQLASGSSDHYVDGQTADAAERILAAFRDVNWSGRVHASRDRLDLFSGWPLLVIVAALLGVEWFLRRRNGML